LVGGRVFIFQMCIPSGKTFHLIPWPWPTDIWPFRKFLTLVINTCKTFFECSASLKFLTRQKKRCQFWNPWQGLFRHSQSSIFVDTAG
jgi:hypothetical protein